MITSERFVDTLPISMLRRQETARVVDVIGDSSCVQRLNEMGMREGVKLTMLSPGKPFIIAVEGRRISLRFDCDADILVEPTGFDACTDVKAHHQEIVVERC